MNLGPSGDGTWNLGVCPGQEPEMPPSGVPDDIPTNWATQARAKLKFFKLNSEPVGNVV